MLTTAAGLEVAVADMSFSAASIAVHFGIGDGAALVRLLTSGNDHILLTGGNDLFRSFDRADSIKAGTGNDTVFAGLGDDQVFGQGGNDVLDGEVGTDTAFFTGVRAEYTVVKAAHGSVTVTGSVAGRDGVDVVRNIEKLQFLDQLLDQNGVPQSLGQLFAANPDTAKGLASAYEMLLAGVPNEAGFPS